MRDPTSIATKLLTLVLSGALLLCNFPIPASAQTDWNIYFGQLHSHSGRLDDILYPGYGPAQAYAQVKAAGNMDFFGLTDFSHSLETAENDPWTQGKAAAAAATDENFAALYGYELGWRTGSSLGHICTFGTETYHSRSQYTNLVSYYDTLSAIPGAVGQFSHPDNEGFGSFENFGHHCFAYDEAMALLEVMGEDGQTFFQAYQKALDAGWHVAPTASGVSHKGNWAVTSPVRTAILAKELSSEGLLDALGQRRVYATQDPDLEILYTLGGQLMGSRLTHLDSYRLDVTLSQPSGILEVVTQGGKVLKTLPITETTLTADLTEHAGYPYYYLRITQADGSLAVTAPVWVEPPEDLGIRDWKANTSVPVQGEELTFSFTLYNQERMPLAVSDFQLLADGLSVHSWEPFTLAPGESRAFTLAYTHQGLGVTKFCLSGSGTIDGSELALKEDLTLSFLPALLNAHIMVDGSGSAVSYDDLKNLTAIAANADMDVGIFRSGLPEGNKVWIIPAPEQDFPETYPQAVREFVENGGHLILCGGAGGSARLNALLESIGSTMALHYDTATDPVHNGGRPEILYPQHLNTAYFSYLPEGSFYCHRNGCTIDPGEGTWLVRGGDTMEGKSRCLAARETIGKGAVTIAGSFFLGDDSMPLPKNTWDPPRANQLLIESILEIQRENLPITNIKEVRSGVLGGVYRVRGYVTAGTSDPNNRFPGLIYLQDDTGGIEITSFEIPDIEVGQKLDILGQLHLDGNNPALKLIRCREIKNDRYRFAPDRLFHRASMNYERHGGELMKVEGVAKNIQLTEDGKGVKRFTLLDPLGNPAEILVEDYILSGAYGTNSLAKEVRKGENVRAYGILHLEEDGTAVLRVRNCDEVVYIPPIPERPEKDRSNPKTGDTMALLFAVLGLQ